ncbi:MAG: DUF3137 domain-containing protein [Actinomycetota bacterium]
MTFLIILLVVIAVAVGAYVSYQQKQKRRRELAMMAKQFELEYSEADTQGCLGLPFNLLSKGDGRGVENVLWGTWQDTAVREFDYWYYEESTDSEGHRTKTYYRFSCAVTEIEAFCSPLMIHRENVFTRLADHIGLPDIEFESEEFNNAFNVKGKDRKFANDFLDARMMQHLLHVDGAFQFEVSGKWLLCFSKRRRPMDLIPLVGTLKQFREFVPRVVYQLYGPGQQQVG